MCPPISQHPVFHNSTMEITVRPSLWGFGMDKMTAQAPNRWAQCPADKKQIPLLILTLWWIQEHQNQTRSQVRQTMRSGSSMARQMAQFSSLQRETKVSLAGNHSDQVLNWNPRKSQRWIRLETPDLVLEFFFLIFTDLQLHRLHIFLLL